MFSSRPKNAARAKKTFFRSKNVDTDSELVGAPDLRRQQSLSSDEDKNEKSQQRSKFFQDEQNKRNLPKFDKNYYEKQHKDLDRAFSEGLDAQNTQNNHVVLLELERIATLPECKHHDEGDCDCELINHHYYINYHQFNKNMSELILYAPQSLKKILEQILQRSFDLIENSSEFVKKSAQKALTLFN